MSKGVIVQLEQNVAHILKNDGAYISCTRDSHWRVGDVITITKHRTINIKITVAACVVLLLSLIGAGIFVYNIPVAYIEISVNPSVQMTVNRFYRVLSATGLDESGDALLQGASYKNLSLSEAYARLLSRLDNDGYLNDATLRLAIGNDSNRQSADIEETLREISNRYALTNQLQMSIQDYSIDEYLSMNHPLPETEFAIPETNQTAPVMPYETPGQQMRRHGCMP